MEGNPNFKNTSGEENQTSNMYVYNGSSGQENNNNNEIPQESDAIRRSLGKGDNPYSLNHNNNINTPENGVEEKNIRQSFNNNIEKKIEQNYEGKTSENRFLDIKESQSPFEVPAYAPYDNQGRVPFEKKKKKNYIIIYTLISFLQILLIVLIAVLYEMGYGAANEADNKNIEFSYYFHLFKDVHLMIFIGFGLLYAALKDHQWSSIAIVLFIGTISFEISFLWNFLWYNSFYNNERWEKMKLNFDQLIQIDYISAPVFITLAGVIGKLSITQYVIISIFETFFGSLNYYLCYSIIHAIDNGGSLYIHVFGAVFGIVILLVNYCRKKEDAKISSSPHEMGDYYSNIISFIGTLFLWLYFPSFNVARIQSFYEFNAKIKLEDIFPKENTVSILRYRGIVNSYLSMIGATVGVFTVSPLTTSGFFKMSHLLNASFVGGIIIGGCCTICSAGWGAVLIGFIGGCLSTLGLGLLQKYLKAKKYDDIFGMTWTFGVSGLLGGIFNCIFMGNFANSTWGNGKIFDFFGVNRGAGVQGGIQFAVIFITIMFAVVGGLVTGAFIRFATCDRNEIYFVDSELFIEDENLPMPEWKYRTPNSVIMSSSRNKFDGKGNVEIQ